MGNVVEYGQVSVKVMTVFGELGVIESEVNCWYSAKRSAESMVKT